jgi:hypothetical protein
LRNSDTLQIVAQLIHRIAGVIQRFRRSNLIFQLIDRRVCLGQQLRQLGI